MLVVALVIAACAVVQSVFGVGLLVFGTPTLLVMGYGFGQSLAYLLPCSLAISVLQLAGSGGLRLDPLRRRFLLYTAPAVLAGTVVVLAVLGSTVDVKPVVGAMLLATALLRAGRFRERMQAVVRGQLRPLLVGLGVLHGFTNLGGGLLTVIVGSISERKDETRRQIAFCYGLMATIQLATLAATTSVRWNLFLPVLAAAVFLLAGRRVFAAAGQFAYQWGLTGLIASYGVLLIIRP